MAEKTLGEKIVNVEPVDFSGKSEILRLLSLIAGSALLSGERVDAGDYTGTTGYYGKRSNGEPSAVREVGDALGKFVKRAFEWQYDDYHPFETIVFDSNLLVTDAQSSDKNKEILQKLRDNAIELRDRDKNQNDRVFRLACSIMWFGDPGTTNVTKTSENKFLGSDKTRAPTIYSIAYTVTRVLASILGSSEVSSLLEVPRRAIEKQLEGEKSDKGESGGGSASGAPTGGRGGGGGAPPPAPSAPSETLAQFLDKHKDKTGGKPDVKAFAQAIIDRSTNARGSARYEDYSGIIANPLAPVVTSGAGSWRGATIEDRSFDGSESGLRDYLAFAWAATRTGGEVGADVAQSMGIEPRTEGNFAQNPDWILLGKMGAISPFRFMAIYKPAGVDQIPEGATLSVGGLAAETTAAHKNGFFLNIGVTDYTEATGFYGEDAKVLLGLSGAQEWTLTFGGKSWKAQNAIKYGAKITTDEWISSEAPAEAAGPPTAAELSGAISVRNAQITREGTTTGGDRTFDLQNMLSTSEGAGVSNIVSVTLEKRIVFTGDRWTLRVNNPGNYAILIPIRLKQPLSEAAPHWVKSFTGTSSTRPAFAYFPTSMIEWVYDKKFYKYGPTSPRIVRIDYEPSDIDIEVLKGEFKEKGITVISIDEAKRSGTASGEFDTIESAIANYISLSDQKNPVGVALYLTSNLNGQMNSYQKRTYKFG